MPTTLSDTKQQVVTRDRIIFAAAELFRRQGYAGTGLKQIATQAKAPFGSIYHFFPGGKEQLADEVLRTGGAFFEQLYVAIVREQSADLVTGIHAFFIGAGETLLATDFQDACPIATVAGEVASTDEVLRIASADVFGSWIAALSVDLESIGIERAETQNLALSLLALLEGAFLLGRVQRSDQPMTAAAKSAQALLSASLSTNESAKESS